MLGDRIAALGQLQPVAGQVAADRKQHRDAAPHRLGRVGEALGIEIEQLAAAADPARDQAAPLGHQPQLVAAGWIGEFPVGIGRLALD